MAIVSTEKTLVCGEWFDRKIKVNADGVFSIEYPDFIQEKFSVKAAIGETKSDALIVFRQMAAKYTDAKTSSRKVILYNMQHTKNHEKAFERFDQLSFSEGEGFTISAGVFIEEKTDADSKTTYGYKLDRNNSEGLPHHSLGGGRRKTEPEKLCLNWTQDLEDMFRDLVQAMDVIQYKIAGVLQDETTLLDFINSGQKLLPKQDGS